VIGDLDARSGSVPSVDGELVTQREDLELERDSRSKADANRGDNGEEDRLHEGRRVPRSSSANREALASSGSPKELRDDGSFETLGTDRLRNGGANQSWRDVFKKAVNPYCLLPPMDRVQTITSRAQRFLRAAAPATVRAVRAGQRRQTAAEARSSPGGAPARVPSGQVRAAQP